MLFMVMVFLRVAFCVCFPVGVYKSGQSGYMKGQRNSTTRDKFKSNRENIILF